MFWSQCHWIWAKWYGAVQQFGMHTEGMIPSDIGNFSFYIYDGHTKFIINAYWVMINAEADDNTGKQ